MSDEGSDWEENEVKTQKKLMLKVVVIGDAKTGKSVFVQQFCHNKILKTYKATVGFEIVIKKVSVDTDLHVWDIAGDSLGSSVIFNYLSNANGVLIMYDVTDFNTFKSIPQWFSSLNQEQNNLATMLIGNKIDMREKIEVTCEQHNRLAQQYNICNSLISAFNLESVTKVMKHLVELMKQASEPTGTMVGDPQLDSINSPKKHLVDQIDESEKLRIEKERADQEEQLRKESIHKMRMEHLQQKREREKNESSLCNVS